MKDRYPNTLNAPKHFVLAKHIAFHHVPEKKRVNDLKLCPVSSSRTEA